MVWLCAAALALTGCLTTTSAQSAETLGPGRWSFGAESGAFAGYSFQPEWSRPVGAIPSFNLLAERGLSDNLDLGARLGTSGIGLDAKWRLRRGSQGGPTVSLAPMLLHFNFAFAYLGGRVEVPLLIGWRTQGGTELVLAPSLQTTYLYANHLGGGSDSSLLFHGGLTGTALRQSEDGRFEYGVSLGVLGTAPRLRLYNPTSEGPSLERSVVGTATVFLRYRP